jgi:hypothetical protein
VAVCAALTGCGYSRSPVGSVNAPVPRAALLALGFPKAGIAFRFPSNWTRSVSHLPVNRVPLVATISSGPVVIALWRYPRSLAPPVGRLALSDARASLISAARARDPSIRLIRTRLTEIGGAPTVELAAFERIAGHLRRVRSLHMFVPGGEIVLEEYAPPPQFHAVDHDVFSPLNHSINLRRSEGH